MKCVQVSITISIAFPLLFHYYCIQQYDRMGFSGLTCDPRSLLQKETVLKGQEFPGMYKWMQNCRHQYCASSPWRCLAMPLCLMWLLVCNFNVAIISAIGLLLLQGQS